MEYTSYVMDAVYKVEDTWRKNKLYETELSVQTFIKNNIINSSTPMGLEYLYRRHDPKTGMTGVAFMDTKKKEIIIGYAGTNNSTDAQNDWRTDVVDIALGQGGHYQSAINFYKGWLQGYDFDRAFFRWQLCPAHGSGVQYTKNNCL